MTTTFHFYSGNPSLDLINTEEMKRGKRVDSLSGPEDLALWVQTLISMGAFVQEQFGGSAEKVDEAVLSEVKVLRAKLRELFEQSAEGGTPPPECIGYLELLLRNAPLSYQYKADRLIPIPLGSLQASLLSLIALDALEICTSGKLQGLHRCGNPRCIWLYLDYTGKRKWCSMKLCGNRMKASRFKVKSEGQQEELTSL
ncbi:MULTISPECIES: ABATE domain-containing protein [unclassified Paenibacillus]|uniref:CGNR zinc finger domain-containing protein n=1 Tax=unclassified Paenibacillus TaxID=185978 RepID=UPI0024059B39|nr:MULTISPECIES: ABATE domain-containing protein [unclassified Paenibacillus]MDF9841285.1 putative RNA-binding Zn ribbon-like protein [Paenibacillus sp. PastF-2]MDF9847876.1 putative RNA-binding Zn ribbon-like protein [Paenibacillus sp. PastM-2]MDF9854444.1 putative RNA-binding Zn ribbon-like protein [Paenibacillus sp. PastF-1]MDH6479947.1 putative RNA-binding Zn ribbon-like protein [Paenibacillus sp. PastH-2]MDH6507151.1 putative RNA-binding Zn ribbon-like protein [Paenibacillus sp. PastM-3]